MDFQGTARFFAKLKIGDGICPSLLIDQTCLWVACYTDTLFDFEKKHDPKMIDDINMTDNNDTNYLVIVQLDSRGHQIWSQHLVIEGEPDDDSSPIMVKEEPNRLSIICHVKQLATCADQFKLERLRVCFHISPSETTNLTSPLFLSPPPLPLPLLLPLPLPLPLPSLSSLPPLPPPLEKLPEITLQAPIPVVITPLHTILIEPSPSPSPSPKSSLVSQLLSLSISPLPKTEEIISSSSPCLLPPPSSPCLPTNFPQLVVKKTDLHASLRKLPFESSPLIELKVEFELEGHARFYQSLGQKLTYTYHVLNLGQNPIESLILILIS